jgi:hypothetical protein
MNTVMKIAEDQDLYLKMYEKGKVKFINETNYLYRLHSEEFLKMTTDLNPGNILPKSFSTP